ncbi:response regulator [Cohnella hashimotonis]|uniref:Response regulator n=1 Tax=Cohnella hashimotonis TaxID=2826895 RepID=A0ABT6TPJ4_9BACL|nr:response regulator [Cohnella hashimotonis]MDI4648466.1 response regulator [Cohnella hashimotonis]
MLSLLIVDDFEVEREEAIEIIEEAGLPVRIFGEATNGKEALRMLESQQPDIILVDVEMPLMNGIEMAKIVKQKYPAIKMIFFSFYNKFEYVKKAIDLSSHGYVLKPIVPAELVEALQRTITLLHGEIQKKTEQDKLKAMLSKSMPALVEKFSAELFSKQFKNEDELWDTVDFFKIGLKRAQYMVCVLEIDDYQNLAAHKSMEDKQLLSLYILQMIEDELATQASILTTRLDESHYGVLFSYDSFASPSKILEQTEDALSGLIERLYLQGISCSAGLSEIGDRILSVSELCEQGLFALKFKFHLGKQEIIHIRDVETKKSTTVKNDWKLPELQKELKFLIHSGNSQEIDRFVEQFSAFSDSHASADQVKGIFYGIVTCLQFMLMEENEQFERIVDLNRPIWEKWTLFETVEEMKAWLKQCLMDIAAYLEHKKQNKNTRLIHDIQTYIKQNLREELSLKSISSAFFYSPNYINSVFKREMNTTISEYVIQQKIDLAKEMLANPQFKIYEISESIGYVNEAHFRSKFKELTGYSPKEFRERI